MQYYLSRNNIITGPYSKDAIIQHGIFSTDLVRENDNAEWRTPYVFEELKNNIATSKPKYKITANKEVIEIKGDKKAEPTSSEMPANSPFKRTPSVVGKNKPENKIVPQNEKLIVKKEVVRNNINAKPEPSKRIEKNDYKKYAQPSPLSNLRKKENSSAAMKEIFAPLLVIGGIGLVVWLGYKKFSSNSTTTTPVAVQANTDTASKATVVDSQTIKPIEKKRILDSTQIYARRDSIRRAEQARKDSLAQIAKIIPAIIDSPDIKKEATAKPIVIKKEPAVTVTNPVKTVAKKDKSISDYVALSLNKVPEKEVKNIKINVKNIGDHPLNIAVIDVSYKDTSGKIIHGETLQAENIGVGKTKTVKVPNDKNASDISYKVSLISGDSVYLMNN